MPAGARNQPEICTDTPYYYSNYYVYVTYSIEGLTYYPVYFSRSTDKGLTWSTPVEVTGYVGMSSGWQTQQDIAYGPSGLYIIFEKMGGNGSSRTNQIWVTKSTDWGATWNTPIQVTSSSVDCYHPRIAVASNGTVMVTYTIDLTGRDLDIFSHYSTDGGTTWNFKALTSAFGAQKEVDLTTPIYYVNDIPHIGHSYTTIAADVLARYKRARNLNVFFLTGTDEHGQKIQKAAQACNKTPIEFVNEVVEKFKTLWNDLNISHVDFIRTTEERHCRRVEKIFQQIRENGDIYLGEYEGWYCIPCESFWIESQLKEKKCPECNRSVEKVKEKNYFFRLSKYQNSILEYYDKHPSFVQPESRRNELLQRIKSQIEDVSISRSAVEWGIPVPSDPTHTIYVWIDALLNYITRLPAKCLNHL